MYFALTARPTHTRPVQGLWSRVRQRGPHGCSPKSKFERRRAFEKYSRVNRVGGALLQPAER